MSMVPAQNAVAAGAEAMSPIFSDNFEGGDTSKWSRTVGTVRADPFAAMTGSNFGLLVIVNNRKSRLLVDNSPSGQTLYKASFQLDINKLNMGRNNKFRLFKGQKGTVLQFFLLVRKYNNKYWIKAASKTSSGKVAKTKWAVLPNSPVLINFEWKASTSLSSPNGHMKLWKNGVLTFAKGGISNKGGAIKSVKIGVVNRIKSTFNISGKFYIDNFTSQGDTISTSPAKVVITHIRYDGVVPIKESDEYVVIDNQGGSSVNLKGWRLYAGDPGQNFYFPSFDLKPGQKCRVYTNEVHTATCGFSFKIDKAIWNNGGDCGSLFNSGGKRVSYYCYWVGSEVFFMDDFTKKTK